MSGSPGSPGSSNLTLVPSRSRSSSPRSPRAASTRAASTRAASTRAASTRAASPAASASALVVPAAQPSMLSRLVPASLEGSQRDPGQSRAEFGDIFATSPLQNASSSIGSGTILKGIKQQFTQGNISSSLNALDLAISGQGFFALKPSLTSAQIVYTRNGSLSVNDDRYVVDSAGQYLLVFPVNNDGSVTAKDIISASPLQLPVTSGEPQATNNIQIGVNVPAGAEVVTEKAAFADGYTFNPSNPETYNNSTSITIFDDLGNPTIATIYFIKTQTSSAEDPTNKVTTKLVINDTVIDPDLVKSIDDAGKQQFIDKFGNVTTKVPDDNYFLEGKGSKLYKADDLRNKVNSSPAQIKGEVSEFDFGEEGDRLVEIVTEFFNPALETISASF